MSQKILASALLIAPTILLTSCGNNEPQVTPAPINATPEVKKVDVVPITTESTTTGTLSPTDIQTGSSSMQKPDTEINPVIAPTKTEKGVINQEDQSISNKPSTSNNTTPASPQPAIIAGASVTKQVQYTSPAGKEDVEFTITTSGDTITAVSAKPLASNSVSKMLQIKFSEAISKEVVGKKKSELQLHAIGGASLTTNAFNQFVAQN